MKSSPISTADDTRGGFFVGDGGMPYHPSPARDPLDAWISLMEAVEALCPRWPAREHRMTGDFKL